MPSQKLLSVLQCYEENILCQCGCQQILTYCVSCTCTGCNKARTVVECINAKSSRYPKTTFIMSLLGSATTFTGLHASMKACFIPCCAIEGCAITTGAMGVVLQAFYEYILITKSGSLVTTESDSLLPSDVIYTRVSDSSKNVMFFFCFVASVCSAVLVWVDLSAILIGLGLVDVLSAGIAIFFAVLNFIISVLSGQNVLEKFFEVIVPKIKKDISERSYKILMLLTIYLFISCSVMFTYSAPFMYANPFWNWEKAPLYQKFVSMLPAMLFNASVIPSYFNFMYDVIHGQVGPKDPGADGRGAMFNMSKWMVIISMLPLFILSAVGNGLSSGKLVSTQEKWIKIVLAVCQGITVSGSSLFTSIDMQRLMRESLPSLDGVAEWGRTNCCMPCLVTTQPTRINYQQIEG